MYKASSMFVVAALLAFGGTANAQVIYQIDDGVSENALGHGANGDFLWGNYFDELPDGATITGLSVAFGDGGIPVGTAFEVAIYEDMDDDGDPTTNLQFLVSVAGTVDVPSPVGMDTFQDIDIPDTVISGGFFVAAFMDGTNNPFPGMMDMSTTQMRSWFAENDVIGVMDITNPFGTATLFGLVDTFAFPGNWLIRAESAAAVDCKLGDVNLDGSVNLLDVTPFVDRVTTGMFQCEADVNKDGSVNLLDVNPFVGLLGG